MWGEGIIQMNVRDSRGTAPRAGDQSTQGAWKRLTALAIAATMVFTIGPVTSAFAEDADVTTQEEATTPTTEAEENAVSAGETTTPESETPDPGTDPEVPVEPEEPETGVQPLADSEDLPGLAFQVRIAADGTETWDADDAAGNDSGPNNGIVRVNDTVRYEVEYGVSNNDAANMTWSITFPKGMELTEVPGYCQATGSSLVPATAGTPAIPLTANSINELSEQTLTCNMGDRSVATDKVFVTTKVLNLAHQAQDLPLVAATLTADGVVDPISATPPLPSVKASARLMWDISKNGIALDENTGYVSGPADIACPWNTAVVCKVTYYSMLFSAPAGGKGAMPAVGDVTFVDDLSPEAMYPSLSASQHAAINADLEKYGSRVVFANADTNYNRPGHKIGGTLVNALNSTNSVRDSGAISVNQAGPGEPAEFTIRNADWSLRTYPTQVAYPAGNAISGGEAYAVSSAFRVYTPVPTVRDFGIESNNSWTLGTYNSFTGLDIKGFDAASDVQTSADQPGADAANLPAGAPGPVNWNDYRTTTPLIKLPGGFDKFFMGMPGLPGNMSPTEFSPGSTAQGEGPPGGATRLSGGITVAPTQLVTSQLAVTASTPSLPADVSWVGCDAWDNSKLNLATGDFGPGIFNGAMQKVPSSGEGVWVSGYNNIPEPKLYATEKSEVPDLSVQYSAQPGAAGVASTCGEEQGPWYDDPAQVPGNDSALAAEGIYTGVSRVRVHMVIPPAVEANAATGLGVRASVSIALRVADTGMVAGTVLPNWASEKRVNFDSLSLDEVIEAPSNWWRSTYSPDAHSGSPGDRLILALAQARIDKQVRKGDSGAFSSTPPQVTGGDLVQYQLSPSLTSGAAAPGILKDVWVEDCLPASQLYDTASIAPAVVTLGSTPVDAQRPACEAGETYIRWVLPDHEVNTMIDPIILSVEVSPTADDGVYTNTVVVWAEDDESPLALRRDQAQIQIANIAGIKLEKVALTPVVQVNRAGQAMNELNKWMVRLTNTLPASEQSGVSNPDMIDVLPKQGSAGTEFAGTFTFVSATPAVGDTQTRILYTRTANVSANPQDASNGAAGATTWCDAPAGGTRVSGVNGCPTDASEVTGLRIQRTGEYKSGDVIEVEVAMVGVGNEAGDVYVNRVMAAATGLDNTVGPIRRPEVAIASSIGDYVWWDLNRNGVQDEFQGAPEQPAANITVRISGTDDLGNAVSEETQTDANGKYTFAGLRSSNDAGYTVTFVKPDGSEFTLKNAEGADPALDSNADPATGSADALVLDRDTHDTTIDAGLLPIGGLQILKSLTGAGAGTFAADDTLTFEVLCTFEGEPVNLHPAGDDQPSADTPLKVELQVNGAEEVLSDVIGPLPAFTSCTVTEVAAGDADNAAAPVTVTVPWDAQAQKSGVVTASLTNFYSAGSIQVAKTLEGDQVAVDAAADKVFEILVTCQIEETGPESESIYSTLYSGVVLIKGGQTKLLVGEDGEPRVLPLDARCFGEEVNNGGAAKSEVDFDSWDNSAKVTDGTPEEMQALTLTAVNTFENAELTVSKTVVGPGTGDAYDFTLGCTITGTDDDGQSVVGKYALPDADASFSLKDGESRTITVPAGVTCKVAETNVPKHAKVSIVDSDDSTEGGDSDGIVAKLVGTDNTVDVTNTFPVCEDCEPPGLPITGAQLGGIGLLAASLLLAGGVLFFVRRRQTTRSSMTE